MQRRLIYKIYTGSLVFGLLMTNAMTAYSDSEKALLKYSPRLLAGQWNPWALPEVPQQAMSFQCPVDEQSQQFQDKSVTTQEQDQNLEFRKYQSGRFVSPSILESLKQQQIQTQMTPNNGRYSQLRSRQQRQQRPVTRLPEKRYYAEPSYGMGSTNPLYDAPAVSPWGSAPDVIYQGGSFPDSFSGALSGVSSPWVPSEAVGGLPPIHVPPFNAGSNWKELKNTDLNNAETGNVEAGITEKRIDNNVFNPFAFKSNRSW